MPSITHRLIPFFEPCYGDPSRPRVYWLSIHGVIQKAEMLLNPEWIASNRDPSKHMRPRSRAGWPMQTLAEHLALLQVDMERRGGDYATADAKARAGGTPGWGGELKEMDLGVLYWVRDVAKPEELPEFVIQVVDEWDAEDAERYRLQDEDVLEGRVVNAYGRLCQVEGRPLAKGFPPGRLINIAVSDIPPPLAQATSPSEFTARTQGRK